MNRFARPISALSHRAVPVMLLLAITTIIAPALPSFPHDANALPSSGLASFVGRVCFVPGESTACPQTLSRIPRGSPGSQLNVSINILGSAAFNQFNIRVRSDPTVINVTGVDFAGTILPSATTILQCVNGGGIACGSLDGPGVVSVNATGGNTIAPASGRLFKISYLVGSSSADISVGFQTGCVPTSVPNTSACVLVIERSSSFPFTFAFVPEAIQSQLLGVHLPTALASVLPPGKITGNISGGASNSTDTYVLPYPVALPGNITSWLVQFRPYQGVGGINIDVASVQIKVFRHINATTLIVVGAGLIRDPRPILQSRLPSYPFVTTEETVIPYYADPSIAIQPGDLIGISITSPSFGIYRYPAVNASGTRYVNRDVPLGRVISLSNTTFTVPNGWGPALEVFIQVPPPTTDTAGDGITDFVKLSPEMQALGADPCRKTVAVQLDYMVRPFQAAIDAVVQSFDAAPVPANVTSCPYTGFPLKPSGVKLIIDVKNQVPEQDFLNFTHSEPLSFDSVKAAFFDPNRVQYFHYGIWAHALAPLGTPQSTVSGVGEIFGSNFMVTLGEWPNVSVKEEAGTLMHELGHNLGLDHGGSNAVNFKPNYLSVMNYAFQVVGITSQTSNGGNVTRFDYSSQTLPSLNETALDETTGLSNSNNFTRWVCPDGRHVNIALISAPMDWNCNGVIDTARVSVDINNATSPETLTGYNDWANLRYKFTESENFGPGCRAGCDIGCRAGCDIGCRAGCDIGTELALAQARIIEAQWAAFFASPHRSTSTSVNCSPATVPVNSPTTCMVTVTDTATSTPAIPTGTVSFSGPAGTFTPAATCTLGGTGASASCTVTYTPNTSSLGSQTISAFYPADTNHTGSSGSTVVNGLPLIMTISSTTTLTSDTTAQIVIGADKIILNCNGHTISGFTTMPASSPNTGILLNGRTGVTVENCHVTNFYIGIQLNSSNSNTLSSNSAIGNGYGFLLSSSTMNTLSGNTASSNTHDGFRLDSSSNGNGISGNTATGNLGNGFSLSSSVNNDLTSNGATGNGMNGFLLQSSNNNNMGGNVANNNRGSGFLLISSSNNNLQKNSSNNNSVYGFALTSSSNNNSVTGNSACGNGLFDAFQSGSTGNKFKNNAFCTTSGT